MVEKSQHSIDVRLFLLIAGLGLLGATAISAGDTGIDPVGIDNETCLSCHEGLQAGLLRTGHDLSPAAGRVFACVLCHAGAEVHIEDPSSDNITNPAEAESSQSEKICNSCHQPHPGLGLVGQDPHAGQQIACTTCHSVHRATSARDKSLCQTCHVAVTHEFSRRSNHPLTEGTLSCVSCHDFLGNEEPAQGHGGAANCYVCHTEQSGPFLFEHEATSSFSAQGSTGCVSCHSPHGSVNDRLLTQKDANLCKQCHGTPGRHLTAHDGQFARVDCVDCHSDIHGSYDNLYLLDPQLATKLGREVEGCFCHYYR